MLAIRLKAHFDGRVIQLDEPLELPRNVREAEQVIERERLIRLSREDAELVFSLMTDPPKPGPAL